MIALLLAAYHVGTPVSGTYHETCTATVFAWKGDPLAGGATPYLARTRPHDPYVRPTDLGVAHRTLPTGTVIEVTSLRTRRSTRATVIDRGPFGRVDAAGRWYSGAPLYRQLRRAGKPIPREGWRGCLDITPAVAKRIGHNGMEKIRLRVVRWPRRGER